MTLFQRVYSFPPVSLEQEFYSRLFEITIPRHPDPREIGLRQPLDSYEATNLHLGNKGDVTEHDLPGTFSARQLLSSNQFIEYVLRLELRHEGQDTAKICTLPLNIQPPAPPTSISEWGLRTLTSRLQLVKGPKCLPENSGGKFTVRENLRSRATGRIPRYVFEVNMMAPSAIQLGHEKVTPWKMWITPKFGEQFSNFGQGEPMSMPATELIGVRLKLIGHLSCRPASLSNAQMELKLVHDFMLPKLERSPVIPILLSAQDQLPDYTETGRENNNDILPSYWVPQPDQPPPTVNVNRALDLGELYQMHTRQLQPKDAFPSFKSYNMALHYTLDYTFRMRTAGKEHECQGSEPVVLLDVAQDVQTEMRQRRASTSNGRQEDVLEWCKMTGVQGTSHQMARLFKLGTDNIL